MEYVKLEVFGVKGGAPIMAKEHPVLSRALQDSAGEPLAVPCAHKRSSELPLLYADEKFDGMMFETSSPE